MLNSFFSAKEIGLSMEYGFSGFFFFIWTEEDTWVIGLDIFEG